MRNKYTPKMSATFKLVLASTFALSLPITSFAQSGAKEKELKWQEIVVSFPGSRGGLSTRASRQVQNLRVGGALKLTRSLDNGRIGVYTSSSTVGALSNTPIEISKAKVSSMCKSIKAKNPGVHLTCEANAIVEANRTPNDTQWSSLYGMVKINAPSAWDITTGSANVVVAVIDTGIDYNHPDLAANIATNAGEIAGNGIDDDKNGFIDDYYGYDFMGSDSNPIDDHFHGSHCAGTIGAKGDNARGVAGVNWTVKLLAVKVLDSSGSGTLASVASGMNYAVLRGAKIMSMSLGTTQYSATLENAIIYAKQNGVLVVAAAGNDAVNTDLYPHYPSASTQDNVISVAASNSSDSLAYFSNYGPTSVDLAAPGENILSTYLGGQYAYASGTSMATPHVAGMAAMLKAVNPSLTYSQIKSILLTTVDPISSMAGKMVSGGRANLYKAVLKAMESATPTPTPAPTSPPALTPTATPTPAPTSPTNPTPTPTPPAMETPAEEDPNQVSIAVERTRRAVYIFGDVINSNDQMVAGETVTLTCAGRVMGTKRTDSEGYYEFAFKRPSRPVRCWTEDTTGGRSRRITVR